MSILNVSAHFVDRNQNNCKRFPAKEFSKLLIVLTIESLTFKNAQKTYSYPSKTPIQWVSRVANHDTEIFRVKNHWWEEDG